MNIFTGTLFVINFIITINEKLSSAGRLFLLFYPVILDSYRVSHRFNIIR